MLKDSISKRPFASTQQCRKTAITTRILSLVHELCLKQINVTKRDLFYTDVKLFEVSGRWGCLTAQAFTELADQSSITQHMFAKVELLRVSIAEIGLWTAAAADR